MTKTILTDSKTFTKIKDRIPEGTLPTEVAKIFSFFKWRFLERSTQKY
jgi:hypothetical protein